MKLSIIIVSYNVKYYLGQVLRSIVKSAGTEIDYEVWVVDNASKDGTREYLKRTFRRAEWLHTVYNKDNVGFGRANNQALRYVKGDYVLFLNPDTLLGETTLKDTLEFMENHPDAGAVGVRMLHPDGRFALESKRGVPTPWAAACKLLGLTRLFPRSRWTGQYYMQYLAEDEEGVIDIVSGAYMVVQRSVLDKTGGFDESFFMYGEDIDLSYRIQKAGYTNYYLPTPILHYKGASTQKNTFRYAHVFYNAMFIFFNKHYKHSYPLLSIPIRLFTLVAAVGGQVKAWRKYLNPVKYKKERYLFIGRRSLFREVTAICDSYGIDISVYPGTEKSLPRGHNSEEVDASGFDFVVYDVEVFSTRAILGYFMESQKQFVGTYYSPLRTLITHRRAMHNGR